MSRLKNQIPFVSGEDALIATMLLFSPIVRDFDHICMEKARYKFLIIIIIISYFPGCNDLASTSLITAEDL